MTSFGGYFFFHGNDYTGQTEAWNGSQWITVSAGGHPHDPPPRTYAGMIFDPAVSGLVMFGGRNDLGSYPADHALSDTWRLVGTQWVRLQTRPTPPAMDFPSFVYDTDHHFGVMYGKGTWLFTSARAGGGYLMCASDGGIFTFGDAKFYGSTGNIHLNRPIVGIARTPTRRGYWLSASDGGIFAFGDATFRGSTGNIHLNQPIVGMAATPTGLGYWLVARDGGIFTFGDAHFYGTIAAAAPTIAVSASPTGHGYWIFASNGTVHAFGDARPHGAVSGDIRAPIVGATAT